MPLWMIFLLILVASVSIFVGVYYFYAPFRSWVKTNWKKVLAGGIAATLFGGLTFLNDAPTEPTIEPYIKDYAPGYTIGDTTMGTPYVEYVNWTYFKQLFTTYTDWSLEYRIGTGDWQDGNQYLTVERVWVQTSNFDGYWKMTLTFDNPAALVDARFTFAISLNTIEFVEKGAREVWINYTVPGTSYVYQVFFNWSDLDQYSGLWYNKGITDNQFWFRFGRDNIPTGTYVFDPDFGDTTSGSGSTSIEDNVVGTRFTMGGTDGTGDTITAYIVNSFAAKNMKCKVYDASENPVTNGETSEKSVATTLGAWETFTFPTSPDFSASQVYRLVIWSDEGSGVAQVKYDTSGGTGVHTDATTYNGFPNPYSTSSTIDADGKTNIYCTYTESGNSLPTVDTFVVIPDGDNDYDQDNNDCTFTWTCTDADPGDDVDIYITVSVGGTPRVPTTSDYDFFHESEDGTSQTITIKSGNEATWAPTTTDINFRCYAYDDTNDEFSTDFNTDTITGIDGDNGGDTIDTITSDTQPTGITGTATDATSGVADLDIKIQDTTAEPDEYWTGSTWSTSVTWLQCTADDGNFDSETSEDWTYSGIDYDDWPDYHAITITSRVEDTAGNIDSTADTEGFTTYRLIETALSSLTPYLSGDNPRTITSAADATYDSVTFWYRYSNDNTSWYVPVNVDNYDASITSPVWAVCDGTYLWTSDFDDSVASAGDDMLRIAISDMSLANSYEVGTHYMDGWIYDAQYVAAQDRIYVVGNDEGVGGVLVTIDDPDGTPSFTKRTTLTNEVTTPSVAFIENGATDIVLISDADDIYKITTDTWSATEYNYALPDTGGEDSFHACDPDPWDSTIAWATTRGSGASNYARLYRLNSGTPSDANADYWQINAFDGAPDDFVVREYNVYWMSEDRPYEIADFDKRKETHTTQTYTDEGAGWGLFWDDQQNCLIACGRSYDATNTLSNLSWINPDDLTDVYKIYNHDYSPPDNNGFNDGCYYNGYFYCTSYYTNPDITKFDVNKWGWNESTTDSSHTFSESFTYPDGFGYYEFYGQAADSGFDPEPEPMNNSEVKEELSEYGPEQTIDNSHYDYFIWLGDDDATASDVRTSIGTTVLNSADEYIYKYDGTDWDTSYSGTQVGTNFNVDTFEVLKIDLNDGSGTTDFVMSADHGTTYDAARLVTLTGPGDGFEYTSWCKTSSSVLSTQATTLSLSSGPPVEYIGIWDKTVYDWHFYFAGWGCAGTGCDKTISQYSILLTRVDSTKTDWSV